MANADFSLFYGFCFFYMSFVTKVLLSGMKSPNQISDIWVARTFQAIDGQQSSERTALVSSRPQRLICSRRRPYIPATVL